MRITLDELKGIIQETITTAALGHAVMTPLRTGPTYPNLPFQTLPRKKKKKKSKKS